MNVTLYPRQNCPLCDKARAVLNEAGISPQEIDVDLDLDLLRKFTNDVPVIYIDGAEAFRHRIDPEQLRVIIAGWRVVDAHHLEKPYTFPDFASALAFANRVGAVAERLNHHPDILVGWGKVRITTWSHDAGGITNRDWKLAAEIEKLNQSALA